MHVLDLDARVAVVVHFRGLLVGQPTIVLDIDHRTKISAHSTDSGNPSDCRKVVLDLLDRIVAYAKIFEKHVIQLFEDNKLIGFQLEDIFCKVSFLCSLCSVEILLDSRVVRDRWSFHRSCRRVAEEE